MAATFIPVTLSSGIQIILARFMADISDEGLDARTTYFLLAGMFSPVIFWPTISFIIILISEVNFLSLEGIFFFSSLIFVFYLSSMIFLYGYDLWMKHVNQVKISNFAKSSSGQEFNALIKKVNIQLALLK